MASNSDEGSRGNDDSSEEESLATLKRKAYDNYELNDADDNDKRQRMDVESDEGPHPGIFVKVEVEELNYQDDDEAASRDVESPDPEPIKRRTRPSREKIDPDYVSEWRPPKRKKNTSCPDCGKVFENAMEMKKHSIEHQVQTRHKCEVCGRCFSKAFGLKTHKRMHGEKNEHCPICDASFTLAINLNGSRPDETQKELLVGFLESNPDIVKGTDHAGPSKFVVAKKWTEAAVEINSSGVAKKDHKGWAKYWTEKKSFLKRLFTRGETSKLSGLNARLFALVRDEFTQNPMPFEPDHSDSENSDTEDEGATDRPERSPRDNATIEHEDEESNDETSPKEANKESNRSNKVFSPTVNVKASEIQLERLYQFMERNPGIAKGLLKTAQGRIETNRKWASVAKTLNSLDGAKKDSRGWAKFWTERKCFLKKLHARRKKSKLSALDARISSLLFDNADISQNQETSQYETYSQETVKEETASDDDSFAYELASLPPKAFRRPSPLQMLRLVEFLECHPDIANCRTLSIQARLDTKAKWAFMAEEFNALGSVKKDGAGWSKFWSEKKFYLKKICAQHQTSRLSALEKRLVAIFDESNTTNSPQSTNAQRKRDESEDSLDTGETYDHQEGLVSGAHAPEDCSSDTYNKQESSKDKAVSDTHDVEGRCSEPSSLPRKAASRPNPSQLLRIVEFLESHPDIANCRTLSMQGRLETKAKWASVAVEFNALGTVKKDGPGWSKYWSEKKFYLKKICAQHQTLRLSEPEKRLVALIEESASNTQRNVHAQSDFTATDEFEGSVDTNIAEGSPVATNSAEVSERQMYALAEFLEHNQQLATGRTRTDDADHKWALFAPELNQIGDAIKDGRGWIKYWVGKKRYLKKVCAQNQISRLSNPELHLATLAGYTRQGGAEDKSHANEEEFSNLSAQSSSQLSVTDEENAPQTGDSRSTFKTILEELKQTFDPKYSRDDPASEVSAFVHSETSAKNVSPSRSDCDVATKSSQPTAAKDRRNGRPSLFQLEVLVEFLEKNPGVALCRFKSPAGRRHVDRKWGQITAQLSALPGAWKDKNGWIKYWTEKKCYLKRLSLNHETARLSDLEKRLLNLINANPTQGNSQKEFPQTEDDTETPEPETIDLRKIEVEQSGIVSNSLRPGHKQMAALVDFLEQHPHIATTSARTSGERRHAAAKWAGVTTVLNQLGCAQKDRVGWNKYWVEKKCYLKKVCAQNQTSRLSDPEIRLAAIVGCLPQSAEALDTVQNADSSPSDSEDPEQTRKDRQVDNTPVELSEESLDDEELTHVEEATANNGLRPSGEQLHALVKFLAKNPRVASGCIRTSLGRTLVAKKWAELTRKINELGGAKKGWRAWVKYWVEKKFHLKKLCAKKKSPQLTDVEIRMAKIIGCLPQSMQDEAEDWNITSTEEKAARTGNDEVKTDEEDIEESSDAEKAPEKQNAVVSNSIRPGNRQMAALAEFFEQNPRLVTSSRTPTKRRQTAAKWNEVTIKLNQLGPAQRDRRGWTKYWVEKKCHLKKVCDQNHTSKLSDTDLRLVAILGSSSQATQDPVDNTIVAPNENDDSRDPSPFSGGGEEYAERTQNEEDNTLLQATEESLEKMAGDQEGAILSSGIRPSKRQTNALLQFLEQNPRVARSCIRTSLARRGVTIKWAELTSKINKLGKVRKSPHGWIKYCAQKKSYLRKFCAQKEPSQLTATQLRMATLLGCLPGATADEVDYKETMSLEEYNTDEEYDCEAKLDAEECSEGHRTEPNSLLQMATLVEFLEQYPHIATGCARTKEERSIDIAKWERVTAKLNQLGNVRKDRKGWKKWWISERAYLRDVVARRTKSQLSPKELRLVALLERNPELNSDNPLSSKANQQDASRDRPSLKQLEALIEFLIKNPGVATFAFQGEVGERHLKRKWDEITAQLNALAGVQDDDQGWIKRWTDWNSHLRKVCEAKQAWTLSDLELRLVSALGYPTDKPRGSVDGRTSVTNKTTDFADHKTRCRLKAEKINRKARRRKIVVLKEEPFVRPELVLAEDPLRLSGFDGHLDTVVPCTETNPFQVDQDVVGTEQGRHMMYHHKRMKCEHCDAFYETKEQLYEHKVAVHPEHPTIPPDVPRKPRSWSTYKIKETTEETPEKRIRSKNDTKATDGDTDDSTDDVDQEDTDNLDEGNNFDVYTKKEDVAYQIQCAIVSKMHKGRSVTDICQIYNLTPEVINEIWEDRDEFVILKRAGRRSIKYMNSVLDRKILDWLNYQKQNDVQVTGKMLMDIAESFAKENGFVAFNGSKKWLDRFKTRYKITFRSTVRRKRVFSSNPNESKWKRQFLEEQWLDARNGFNDEDIYTGDEVGVYYNSSRGRIKKMAGKKYIHGFPKDRLSIFMCTNVTGSDKKKLLVCGTEDPLVHSYRSPDTLPVTYIRHGQGHFTTPMFEEYVKFWNRELQLQSRKAVLILDRATIHSKLTLSHLKLVFVPWKAANTLMPIKNGIFNKFRDEYRRLLVQEKAMNAIRGVDRNLTSLEALNILEKAWDRTPSEAIANCFAATGYDVKNDYVHKHVPVPTVTEDDEVALCRMLSDFDVDTYFHDSQSLDNYITVDDEFLTGHGSNGSVFGGNHKAVDPVTQRKEIEEILPLATERPETDEVECQVTKSRALEDVEIVRRYLQANVTQYDVFTKFMDVERFVLKSTVNF